MIGRFTRNLKAHLQNEEDDTPVGEDIELGAAKYGKAGLQCSFIQSISKWGKFGQQQGGVLYFGMVLKQSNDTKIEWARFDVILRSYKDNIQAPIVLPRYLEPQPATGKDISVNVRKWAIFKPKVDVGVEGAKVAAEVGEKGREENSAKRYYWTLTAYGETEGGSKKYTKAIWEWQANKKASQASTRILHGGAVIVSVVEGDFEIELRLKCRLKGRTKEGAEWIKRKLGFRTDNSNRKITTVHSPAVDKDLQPAASKLKQKIESFNESEQSRE